MIPDNKTFSSLRILLVICCYWYYYISLTDTLLADLQSTTTGLKHFCVVPVDGSSAVVVDTNSHVTMASRLSTDSLDTEGQVSVTNLL